MTLPAPKPSLAGSDPASGGLTLPALLGDGDAVRPSPVHAWLPLVASTALMTSRVAASGCDTTDACDAGTSSICAFPIMRGWANYFKHAACKRTLSRLSHFVWWRVIRWLRALHRWTWTDVRRRFTTPNGRWKPIEADGIELFNPETVPVTRYRYRGNTIPNPWTLLNQRHAAATVESPVR